MKAMIAVAVGLLLGATILLPAEIAARYRPRLA
jgi:hypothetical protein